MGPVNGGMSRKMTGLRSQRDIGVLRQFYLPWEDDSEMGKILL